MPLMITNNSNVTVEPLTSNTGNLTEVSATDAPGSILATNANRKGYTIYNSGNNPVFIGFVNTVSATSHAFQLPSKALYEMPANPVYTGAVFGVCAAGLNSTLEIVEFV